MDVSKNFSSRIPVDMANNLIVFDLEANIRDAIFSIPNDKSLKPDGFISLFFKRSWNIIRANFRIVVELF